MIQLFFVIICHVKKSQWTSTSIINPIPSTSYGTICIYESIYIEFKIIYHGKSSINEWENIFGIGYESRDGNNWESGGSRLSSMWIHPITKMFYFSISDIKSCFTPYPSFKQLINIEYLIIIKYNQIMKHT